jgi:predicted HAD superfamily phosphohydrolase YqeG
VVCWGGGVRAGYVRVTGLDEVLDRVREGRARTVIFDVEPLVAYWDSGQQALDQGVALVAAQAAAAGGVQVVCFATNSRRRPSGLPPGADARVGYLASAGKPFRTAGYAGFPRPGVVVGDQIATDGLLAWRLGYGFVHYRPPLAGVPAGPRLMAGVGRLVRPLVFTRPACNPRHRTSSRRFGTPLASVGAFRAAMQDRM